MMADPVLDDDVGVAGEMAVHVACQQATVDRVTATDAGAQHQADAFSAVEAAGRLRMSIDREPTRDDKRDDDRDYAYRHDAPPRCLRSGAVIGTSATVEILQGKFYRPSRGWRHR